MLRYWTHGPLPFLAALLALGTAAASAAAQSCPPPLADARRLVLVVAESMNTAAATAALYERTSAASPWRQVHRAGRAVVGAAGMGWGFSFRALARAGEPVKVEGDKRAPAGVFGIGVSFGFSASQRPGYLQLRDDTVCVDAPSSPAYSTITSRKLVGPNVSGEDMRRIDLYRRGLVVDYPTDRAARAGSCIFIHVWRGEGRGTAGCVAMPEARIAALQDFAMQQAVIAILWRGALDRFAGCLPPLN
jgi:L,D-peptidoglycan transpeptidase YkuD (ErfK/YbiS/YcfS/YnhG family)